MSAALTRRASTDAWEDWRDRWRLASVTGTLLITLLVVGGGGIEGAELPLVLLVTGSLVAWLAVPSRMRARLGASAPWMSFVIVTALWVTAAFIDPRFIWLGGVAYAEYCVISTTWMAAAAVTIVAVFVGRSALREGVVDGSDAVAVSLIVGFGLLLVHYISDIAAQSGRRRLLIEELEATRARLAATEREAGILEERHRISREIHDTLAQGFTSIVMLLETADLSLSSDSSESRQSIDSALAIARESLVEARRLVWALRPEALAQDGLPGALRRLVDRIAEDHGLRITLEVPDDGEADDPEVDTVLFRVAQEGLANVVKHAAAESADLSLVYRGDRVELRVSDDGRGFDPMSSHPLSSRLPGRVGLRSMEERVDMMRGSFRVDTRPEGGTSITVSIPLSAVPGGADEDHVAI